ncbi:TniQ family protein [Jannaschia formosa]|uniref:TniQ family protein n=1 Tax=Jannaschia formosa TaxID=2259592 RepID=UPI000E1B5D5B|nr:TniQ family protein [Jannaschia formosa]TFL18457.1 hypothetical protein DR046_10220 [Jannaschia formosa]
MGELMACLLPHIPVQPDETLNSFLARLASFHTGMGPNRILADLGINKVALLRGEAQSLDALSQATCVDSRCLSDGLIVVRQRDVLFRGQQAAKTSLSPTVKAFCPDCVAADGAPHERRHRILWCFSDVRWCPVHGRRLSEHSGDPSTGLPCVALSKGAAGPPEVGAPPKFVSFVENRLRGTALDGSAWIDTQSIDQVLTASAMLGGVLEHGHDVRLNRISPDQREAAVERGYRIMAGGRAAIVEALTEIRSASTATAVQAGPLAMYGSLYDWLDRRANLIDPGPIRDALRDHIVEHSAVETGETILGEEVKRRQFYSLQSLADSMGLDRRRLSRLLQKLGHIPAGATDAESGRLVFPADAMEEFCSDWRNAILLHDVPDYIGASKRLTHALYAAGVLEPLVPADEPGAVRKVVFSQRSLDRLLGRIAVLPIAEGEIEDHRLMTVVEAGQRGFGLAVELASCVLTGCMPAYRKPGEPRLDRILIPVGSEAGASPPIVVA